MLLSELIVIMNCCQLSANKYTTTTLMHKPVQCNKQATFQLLVTMLYICTLLLWKFKHINAFYVTEPLSLSQSPPLPSIIIIIITLIIININ